MPERTLEIHDLKELMCREEPLHKDLAECVSQNSKLDWPMLHHPLIIAVPYSKELNAYLNAQYAAKSEALEIALKKADWSQYIFLHERPYRFEALETVLRTSFMNPSVNIIHRKTKLRECYELIRSAWIDSENIYQHLFAWIRIFEQYNDKELLMDADERAEFKALPKELTIWRGIAHQSGKRGISWTLDKDRAVWFAKRFSGASGRVPMLMEGKVNKKDAIALFLSRNEREIVVLPKKVRNVTTTNL